MNLVLLIKVKVVFFSELLQQLLLIFESIFKLVSLLNFIKLLFFLSILLSNKLIFDTTDASWWFKSCKNKLFREYVNFEGFQLYRFKSNRLIGAIEGPPKTFYENGFFLFEMIFPSDYFFKPPKFKFITTIFHPNISEIDGLVSVDILQDQWSPALCVPEKIILSIQSLLDDPNPDQYLNADAAKLFKEDIAKYENVVRLYTSQLATYDNLQKLLSNFDLTIEYI